MEHVSAAAELNNADNAGVALGRPHSREEMAHVCRSCAEAINCPCLRSCRGVSEPDVLACSEGCGGTCLHACDRFLPESNARAGGTRKGSGWPDDARGEGLADTGQASCVFVVWCGFVWLVVCG